MELTVHHEDQALVDLVSRVTDEGLLELVADAVAAARESEPQHWSCLRCGAEGNLRRRAPVLRRLRPGAVLMGRSGSWIRRRRRQAIYMRDDYACVYCGAEPEIEEDPDGLLTLDHLLPVSRGGQPQDVEPRHVLPHLQQHEEGDARCASGRKTHPDSAGSRSTSRGSGSKRRSALAGSSPSSAERS